MYIMAKILTAAHEKQKLSLSFYSLIPFTPSATTIETIGFKV